MNRTISFYKFKCNWGIWEQKIKYTLTMTSTSFQYNNGELYVGFVTHCFHFDYVNFIVFYFWSKDSLKKKMYLYKLSGKLKINFTHLFYEQSMFTPENVSGVIGIGFYIGIPHFGTLSLVQSNSYKYFVFTLYY